ncbi:transcriptional regulator [Burkholderia lata]|uniref:HTH-type transcriptional regulator GltC n=1 Tax=Burkholderia lata (strain ATCC 17760 / DSM 23089 / LMG 22485 / NCIMB 9086 / R18194 / 383) TaxID=482957 RepID=A0A833PMF4_BURL3|nr:LysR family transcriptional regulator [Burkholderia lata]KAF1032877.1 MAG: HTH-type transcriptional regulator GltC [Burkholderia lata]VWB39152.1 transcriptional regulator [Burkholderia lata]
MSALSVHGLTRRVDLFTLRLFLTVVEERQIRRAATRENIAPSAATKRVQDLEDIAGVQLLERIPNGVVPNAAGEVLARYLRQMFENFEDMRRELSEFSAGVRGHVSVASTGASVVQYLGREFGEFARSFPQVELELKQEPNTNLVRAVMTGDVDLCVYVVSADVDDSQLDTLPYRTDSFVAVVPRNHPLAEQRTVKTLDLVREPFIAQPVNTTLMFKVNEAAHALGETIRARFTVSGADVALSLVQAGLGVTVLPECMVPMDSHERCAVLHIQEPWAERVLRVGTRKGKATTSATRALIDQLTGRPKAAPSSGPLAD